jgi:hypothetical protein
MTVSNLLDRLRFSVFRHLSMNTLSDEYALSRTLDYQHWPAIYTSMRSEIYVIAMIKLVPIIFLLFMARAPISSLSFQETIYSGKKRGGEEWSKERRRGEDFRKVFCAGALLLHQL